MTISKMEVIMLLKEKVAIITGGGKGIGRAIALGMAEAGAGVVVADVNAVAGEDTVARIGETGRQVLFVPADVRKPDEVNDVRDSTLAEFGRIDILVNNVGGGSPIPRVLEMGQDVWEETVAKSLTPTFIGTRIIGGVSGEFWISGFEAQPENTIKPPPKMTQRAKLRWNDFPYFGILYKKFRDFIKNRNCIIGF